MVTPKPHNDRSFRKDSSFHSQASIHGLVSSILLAVLFPDWLLPIEILLSFVEFCHSVGSESLPPPWTAARQASLSFTVSWSLLKLVSTDWRCHPAISSSVTPLLLLPSVFPSIKLFSKELVLHIR